MNKTFSFLISVLCFIFFQSAAATPDRTQLAVWANEAIIATYTFNYKTYLQEQKNTAKYFTAQGWMDYNKALLDSKLLETVQKNSYDVNAVATQPPRITTLDPTHWQATMTILVSYQNPQYQQQQNLKVVLSFSQAPTGLGVRGLSASSLETTAIEPPCQCNKP